MRKIVRKSGKKTFKQSFKSVEKAKEFFEGKNESYKLALIEELEKDEDFVVSLPNFRDQLIKDIRDRKLEL